VSVLGKQEILRHFDEFFPEGRKEWEKNVKAAKYYLTLSETFLILPDGRRFGPGDKRARTLVLDPGQTAHVSSEERVVIPPKYVGIIGPRFSSAEQGLFFFGGMLVDPGWGIRQGYPLGEPLSFTIANLGRQPIELRPGEDAIASLAFMKVKGGAMHPVEPEVTEAPIRLREELFAEKTPRRQPCSPLGLVEDLGEVRENVDRLKSSLDQVLLLVVVVLAASLFAGIVAAIIGSSDEDGAKLSTESWDTVGLAIGSVLVGVLLVIAIFYFGLRTHLKWKAYLRGRRLRGRGTERT
jgi:deoxycytidine triphosphate deaminase